MTGPIVTCVPGNRACTACANMCAASWRISSSASGSFIVTISTDASPSNGRVRSRSSPLTRAAIAFLASELEMLCATSKGLAPVSYSRTEPSGRVIFIMAQALISLAPSWKPHFLLPASQADNVCGALPSLHSARVPKAVRQASLPAPDPSPMSRRAGSA